VANWGGTALSSNESLQFAGTAGLDNQDDLTPGIQVNGMTFASDAGAFVLSGNSVNLGGDIVNNSVSTQTIALPLALVGDDRTLDAAVGDLQISGNISESGGQFGIIANGVGTVILSGVNTYSGGTTVDSGTLVITSSGALPAGGSLTVGSGGIFVFDPKASVATTLLVGNTTLDPIAALGGQNQSSVAASADASAIPSPASLAPASSLQDPSAYSAAAIGGTGETVLSLATETVSQTPNSGKLLTALTTVSSTDLQSRGGLIEAHLAIASNSSGHSSVVAATLPGKGHLIPVAFGTSYAESHAVAFATVAKSDPLGAKPAHTGQAAGAAIPDRASVDQAMASGASWLWEFLEPQAQERSQDPDEAILIHDIVLAEYAS
jgi:autotransporter-associated beta strand protein